MTAATTAADSTALAARLAWAAVLAMLAPTARYASRNAATPDVPDGASGNCELIGTFSLVTQAGLGLLCLSSLAVKRSYEYPVRRSWPVWLFDVSKQLLGALGVHIFNVVLSIIKTQRAGDAVSGLADTEDPVDNDACDWYFLNIVFDCTIGVYILYCVFRAINRVCTDWLELADIKSGEYGPDPNKPQLKAYLKQLAIYFTSVMMTKCIVFFVMNWFEKPLLWITSHVLLKWLDEFPKDFEIFMVIFVIPVFMNCLQLILVDNFIKNPYFAVRRRGNSSESNDSDDTFRGDPTLPKTNYGTFSD